VVHQPRHPYSQLLIASVPPPDPRDRWGEESSIKSGELRRSPELAAGCIYRDRCPQAMPRCNQAPPPMVRVGGEHEVACYLY
jgi:oligopeptide/dipeptide ABC transporter ATP-binding protein